MLLCQVIEETLSPTWDELMVFDEILVYGRREDIKANPPIIIVETYDQDKVKGTTTSILFQRSISNSKQELYHESEICIHT